MKLFTKEGKPITELSDWEKVTRKEHWKEGRSALSLADFVVNKGGLNHFGNIVEQVLNDEIVVEKAVPEFVVNFDEFDNGRQHDLAIWADTKEPQKSVFIGIEAKVDENFDLTVSSKYLNGVRKRLKNENTNLPERIEILLKRYFGKNILRKHFDLRYQLMQATSGTIAAEKDISIFYVVVFETSEYEPKKGNKNYKDFQMFLEEIGAEECLSVGDVEVHKAVIDGKELILVYEKIKLED